MTRVFSKLTETVHFFFLRNGAVESVPAVHSQTAWHSRAGHRYNFHVFADFQRHREARDRILDRPLALPQTGAPVRLADQRVFHSAHTLHARL